MSRREKIAWPEANQAYLVAEFARLKQLLAAEPGNKPEDTDRAAKAVAKAKAVMKTPPAIDHLAELFSLSEFERELLLLCAGVEMDSNLAAECAQAQGTRQRAYVTFGLAMATLPKPHWSALTPSRPLRPFRLLEVESGANLTTAPLRIDERILHYLAGINLLDPRLESFLRISPSPNWIAEEHRAIAIQLTQAIESYAQHSLVIHLCGDDQQGQEDAAALAAQNASRRLLVLQAEDVPAVGPDWDRLALLWQRESLLLPGVLLIQCGAAGLTTSARYLVERLPGLLFLASREPVRLNRALIRFDVDKPGPLEQKHLWQRALGTAADNLNGKLDDLSEQFRLSARMIFSTGSLFVSESPSFDGEGLWNACRSLARPKLENLAQRIVPSATWADLVLPELQEQILRQLAAQVRHRMKVYENWGFSARGRRGLGVTALFSGPSGTGKTLAAEVLGTELGLDVYRIDLSAVVSKYIGETEKNLKQVFDAAEEGGVLLLFDEADALFGKRGEVREAHDRYANIEVGYLLQRMEAYQGLAILTTNLKSSMDKAFQRRLRFTVNFPFPDVKQREAIWSRAFPPKTPTVGLEPAKLSQLNVAGGNIRNIALNAAFLAADSNGAVTMAHLLEAARQESLKIERPIADSEVRGWV
jgi:hypothetical protein